MSENTESPDTRAPGGGRPYKYGEPMKVVALYLPVSLIAGLNQDATAKGVSRSEIIAEKLGAVPIE